MGDFNTEAQRHRGDVAESRDAVGSRVPRDRVRLDEVCDLNMGQSPDSKSYNQEGRGIPFYQGNADFGRLHPVPRWWCDSPTKIADRDDILMSVRAPIGALNIAESKCCIGRGLAALRVKPCCDLWYLYYFLKSHVAELNAKGTGSTFKAINKKSLAETSVSLPPLATQRRIAAVLDQICEMKRNAETRLAKLDLLVKSRFVEMFGDPVSNPKGWSVFSLEELAANKKNAFKAGPFGSSLKKEYYVASGYKIYGQEQVISGDPNFGDYYIDEVRFKALENCKVSAGDVLISLVGTYGKTLVIPPIFQEGIINPRLVKLSFDTSRLLPLYFQHYFASESIKRVLDASCHGCTMGVLNLGIIKKLKLPLPPIGEQRSFAAFVAEVDKLELTVRQEIEKVDLLYRAKLQEYFG